MFDSQDDESSEEVNSKPPPSSAPTTPTTPAASSTPPTSPPLQDMKVSGASIEASRGSADSDLGELDLSGSLVGLVDELAGEDLDSSLEDFADELAAELSFESDELASSSADDAPPSSPAPTFVSAVPQPPPPPPVEEHVPLSSELDDLLSQSADEEDENMRVVQDIGSTLDDLLGFAQEVEDDQTTYGEGDVAAEDPYVDPPLAAIDDELDYLLTLESPRTQPPSSSSVPAPPPPPLHVTEESERAKTVVEEAESQQSMRDLLDSLLGPTDSPPPASPPSTTPPREPSPPRDESHGTRQTSPDKVKVGPKFPSSNPRERVRSRGAVIGSTGRNTHSVRTPPLLSPFFRLSPRFSCDPHRILMM